MYSLDRIEGDIAVLIDDDNKAFEINIVQLPPEIKEGDILVKCADGFKIDEEKTKERRAALQKKLDKILKK